MNWVEAQLLKCAAEGRGDPQLARACEIFQDWLTVPRHVVRPGEVLSSIARSHGVGIQDLMEFNNLGNTLSIRPGQVLRVPPSGGGKASSNAVH